MGRRPLRSPTGNGRGPRGPEGVRDRGVSLLPPHGAAKDATTTIPIVFGTGDAVTEGLVTSLAHPGGNLTGLSLLVGMMKPKRLELLSELVPKSKLMALLVNPNNSVAERTIQEMRGAAREKGIRLSILTAGTETEIDTAFASLVEQRKLTRC